MKQRNIGVDLLRIVACYAVVSIHFGWTLPCADFAVPCFFAMSFIFCSPAMTLDGLEKRLSRLYVPFAFWGLLGFVARCLRDRSVRIEYLATQLVFGQTCNSMLWFMSVLMGITIFICLLQRLTPNRFWWMMTGVAVLSLVAEYIGINYYFCSKLPAAISMTVGRLLEMTPYAVLGLFVGRVLLKGQEHCGYLLGGGLCLVCGLFLRTFGLELPYQGFGYGGFVRFISVTGVVLLAVFAVPRLLNWPECVKNTIYRTAGFTAGVYFMCKLVGEGIRQIVWPANDVLLTALVFGSSCLVVFLMRRCRLGLFVK